MKKYLTAPLTALAAALSISSVSVINTQPTAAQTLEFFCGARWNKQGNVARPTTVVRHSTGNIPIINWTASSRVNDTWTPLNRCQAVSQRFNTLNRQGKLQYLALGRLNNQPVICGLGSGERGCNNHNLLLTVTNGQHPHKLLDELLNTRTSASGGEVYLSGNDAGRVEIKDNTDGVVRVSIEDIINAHLSVSTPATPSYNYNPPQPEPQSDRIW